MQNSSRQSWRLRQNHRLTVGKSTISPLLTSQRIFVPDVCRIRHDVLLGLSTIAMQRNFSNRGPQAGADGEGSSRRRELRWRSRGRRSWESRYTVQQKMRRRSAVGAGWESVHIQRSLRWMSRSDGNWGPRFCSTAPAQHPSLPRHQISPVGWPSGGDESRAEVHRVCGGVAELFKPRPAGRC